MIKIKQITTKQEKEDFRQAIKEELKKVLVNVEDNIYDYSFLLYNTKDNYCCMLQKDITDKVRWFIVINEFDPIIIDKLYNFRIQLNKNTTEEELNKFSNKLIKEYNERVRDIKYKEWYGKMLRNGMIEVLDDGSWQYTDKYYEKYNEY